VTPEHFDVVIVGGGIGGLATAYELQKNGVSFAVLESAPRPGGVILSEQVDGLTIDAGPDALLIQKPDGIKLCEELGIGDRLMPTKLPRLAYIQRGGRLHALPAKSVLGIPTEVMPFVTTSLFTWSGKMRMAAEVLVPPKRDESDESIGAFVTRRFGREAATYLAEPLLAGIHAGDVDRLSIKALFPRFPETERKYGSLIRAFRHPPPGGGRSSEGAFKSLPDGLSELTRALVAALAANSIRLATPATAASWVESDRRFRVETSRGTVAGRALVFATPAYVTSALSRDLSPELAARCAEIPYASTATVAFAFVRDAVAHPLNGSGYVVPKAENNGILAVSWLSSKWPHRAPEGKALVRAFIGGARDPGALDRPDGELVSTALAAMTPILGITGAPLVTRVYRWNRSGAQHEVGHLDRLAAIERALAARPGLFVTGSAYRGVGIPDCVADGRATATSIAAWLKS
jgi:oxygen-dependent protoporphyrinogen oxidase